MSKWLGLRWLFLIATIFFFALLPWFVGKTKDVKWERDLISEWGVKLTTFSPSTQEHKISLQPVKGDRYKVKLLYAIGNRAVTWEVYIYKNEAEFGPIVLSSPLPPRSKQPRIFCKIENNSYIFISSQDYHANVHTGKSGGQVKLGDWKWYLDDSKLVATKLN